MFFYDRINEFIQSQSGIHGVDVNPVNVKFRVDKKYILAEMIAAFISSTAWYFLRIEFTDIAVLREVEPMLVGLVFSVGIHLFGLLFKK